MKGIRRTLALFLVPLLIALLAVPAAAAPAKEKTNEDHAAWFELDPVVATTDAESVTITGKVAGNFDMKVVNGAFVTEFVAKGQFSVTVPLAPGANAIQFSGANGNGRFINHSVTVTRAVTPVLTSLSISVPDNLVADGTSSGVLTVTALDQNGNLMSSFNGQVAVVPNGPGLTVDAPAVNALNGVATFVLRAGTQPGSFSLTVAVPGILLPTNVTVEVKPAPPVLTSMSTELSGKLVADGKSTATLTVKALDQNRAVLTSFNGQVAVVPIGPALTVDVTAVNAVAGVATFVLRAGTVVGNIPVTVALLGVPPQTVMVNVEQAPPEEPEGPFLTNFTTSLSGSLVADGQSTATLTVTALDETGAVMTSYNGSVYVEGYGSMLTVEPWVGIAQNGVATFTLKAGTTPGSVSLRVTIPTLDPVTVPVEIAPRPPVAHHLEVTLDGSLVADGQSMANLYITVVDAEGNPVTEYVEPITVTISDPSIVMAESSVLPADGFALLMLTAGTVPGTATVAVSAPGLLGASTEVTVEAAPPRSLGLRYTLSNELQAYSETEATLTIEVVDTSTGEVVTTYTDPLTVTSSNPDSVTVLTSPVVPVNGVAVATLKSGLSYDAAFVTVSGRPELAAVTVPITPLPPPITSLSTIVGGTLKVGDPTKVILTVMLFNAAGELATYYTDPITVVSSDPSMLVVSEPGVATPVDGIAVFELSAGSRHGFATLIMSAPDMAEPTYKSIYVSQPDLNFELALSGSLQVQSPAVATLTITTLDANRQIYPDFTGPIYVSTSNPNVVQVSNTSVYPTAGTATVDLTSWSVAGTATVTVSAPGAAPATIPVTVAPAPAPTLGLVLAVDGSLQAYSQRLATITATVVDMNTGKPYKGYSQAISFASSNMDAARLTSTSAYPLDGVASMTVMSGTSQAPATITVTASGIPAANVVITPQPPAPARIVLSLDGALVIGGQATAVVTATVLDATGQVAVSYGSPITFGSSNPESVLVAEHTVTPVNGVATVALLPGTVAGSATITVTAPELPAASLTTTAEPPMPPHLGLQLQGSLVANNQSQATLSVTVLNADGAVDRTFASPILFASSNPGAVQVQQSVVTPVNGVATVTLKAGYAAATATITGTAPGLDASTIDVVSAAQVPTHLSLQAEPGHLFIGIGFEGLLILTLKDQEGVDMLGLGNPLEVRLTSSNNYAAHFGNYLSTLDVLMTGPSLAVPLFGGYEPGTAYISGTALNGTVTSDNLAVTADIAPEPASLLVQMQPDVVAGSTQTVSIGILDIFGASMQGDGEATVTVYHPDGMAQSLGTVYITGGTGSLVFETSLPGTYTVVAQGFVYGWDWPLEGQGSFTAIP
ncbi:MAG: putative middle wall protein precursor [Symbiobacteriaceae bacterium]|jgi:hypothetical protein|nr:putative middle wall protein precursor [Symbiobacteriaceae bacterium]